MTTFQPQPRTEGCQFPDPFDRLASYREVHLEIGAGVGMRAIRFSLNHPEVLTVAVEKTRSKFEKFKRRITHHPSLAKQRNLLAIHGDAIAWCAHGLLPDRVDRIHLLYPNPEPKNPKARFVNQPEFEQVLKQLKVGGALELATNDSEYADEFEKKATQTWGLMLNKKNQLNHIDPTFQPRTHFEKKYFQRGETLYLLEFSRPNSTE